MGDGERTGAGRARRLDPAASHPVPSSSPPEVASQVRAFSSLLTSSESSARSRARSRHGRLVVNFCRTRTLGIGKRPSDGACTSTLARVLRVAPEPESSTVARLGTRRESGISYTPPRAVRPHCPPWFGSSRFSEKNLSSWLTPPFAPTLPRAEFDDAFDVEVRGDEDGPA